MLLHSAQTWGSIRVESEVGKGTTFHIALPAAETDGIAEPASALPLSPGHGTLLVLEDDPVVGEVLEEMLTSFGYQVDRRKEGEDALKALELDRRGPRLLAGAILDLTIPGGMGGREVLTRLRAFDADFPVLVSSGYSEAAVLADPVAHGFQAAIQKPYRREELEAALKQIL